MTRLHIDFETRSAVDLRRTGVYRYAEDPSTDVWCAAYAIDDAPIDLWVPGYVCPPAIVDAVERGDLFVAHNAAFERTIWAGVLAPRYGWPLPHLEQWRCTMVMALALSLPGSLENAAAATGLLIGKDMTGRGLMLQMAKPRRPRKGEAKDKTLWWEDDERKARLYAYCRQDVEVERQLEKRLLQLRSSEQKLWHLDQIINDRGVYVDVDLCKAALKVVDTATAWLNEEIQEITKGIVTATSNLSQIHQWLRLQNYQADSLDKEAIDEMLVRRDLPAAVRRVLEIRREAAKASVAKITALLEGRSLDNRAKGLIQFHAAGTGRWGGRRFQPQNIKRPDIENVDPVIALVREGCASSIRLTYGEPLAIVGDCLRGMVTCAPGHKIYAADFSNIEGRLIAWFAREEWKLNAFREFDAGRGHDIYYLTAAEILEKKPQDVTKQERQSHGKVPELALGFQGGVGAFQKMASIYGVEFDDDRAEAIKIAWREKHPNVVQFWYAMQDQAMAAIEDKGRAFSVSDRLVFKVVGSFLFMRLPSGRAIAYPYPKIKDKLTPWGEMRPQVCYMGTDTYTRKWCECFAHGGLLFNNAVQGTARDLLAEAMLRLADTGYETRDPKRHGISLTVHDEIVCEVPNEFGSLAEFTGIMTQLPSWAAELPVAAGAWEGARYKK